MQSAIDALKAYQLMEAKSDYERTERSYDWFRTGSVAVVGLGAIATLLN